VKTQLDTKGYVRLLSRQNIAIYIENGIAVDRLIKEKSKSESSDIA
jgi:hypothetical protein